MPEVVGRDVGNAGPERQLAPLAAQVTLEAVLEEIPHALLGLGLRLRVGLAHIGRHQNAHAQWLIAVTVLLEDLGELLLRARGLLAVAARGQKIAVAALGDLDQRLARARARDPDRRMWLLGRARPRIDV